MDDDLKLVERLRLAATYDRVHVPPQVFTSLIAEAAATITRLHGCRTAYQDTIDGLVRERDEALALCERLRLEAEGWAQEARTQRSSLHDAYQAVTGATGEPGDWNGARPVVEAVANLKARAETAEAQRDAAVEALTGLEPFLDAIVCYASSMDEHEPNRLAFNARAVIAASRAIGGGE